MNEENKVDEQTTENQVEETQTDTNAQESEETTTEGDTKPKEEDSTDKDIDYKAELEEETKRRIKAESIIQRNKEKKPEVDDDDLDDEPTYTKEDVDKQVKKEVTEQLESVERKFTEDQSNMLIDQSTLNLDERELIKHHLKNTVRPSGDLRADIDKAKLLANAKRFTSQMAELKRKANSNDTTSQGGGAGQKKKVDLKPQLTDAEKKFRRNLGLSETPEKK